MIKLIASDIDGTLVPEGAHVLDPAYFDVIREMREAGIIFCACSGRKYESMQKLFAPVADMIYFISANGTLVRTKDRVLHSWSIDPDMYPPLLQKLRSVGSGEIVVEGPDDCWIEGSDTPVTRLMRDQYKYSVENIGSLDALVTKDIIKISFYYPRVEDLTEDFYNSRFSKDLSMTVSGKTWLDFTAAGTGKGTALAFLKKHLGIRSEETVYFGDNLNDLSAFQEAGVTGTVQNARPELHEAADIVAPSFTDRGVLQALRHLLDLKRQVQAANNA